MPQYQVQGTVPHKRHTQVRDDSGTLLKEELISFQGFADVASLLYHLADPTEVLRIEPHPPKALVPWDNDVHRHHRLVPEMLVRGGGTLDSRSELFFNSDVVISIATPDADDQDFYRNGLCDEFIVVASGTGRLASQYGTIAFEPGDMIVVPRGTTQLWRYDEGSQRMLVVESRTAIKTPGRYMGPSGQFLERSPYCERDFKVPALQEPVVEDGEFPIRVKMGEQISVYHMAWHPFDLAGWDGCAYPFALNTRDFEPVTRRIHTMPDEQAAFEFGGGIICCIVPRVGDYHPLAVPSPPYHSNIDCDEVGFWLTDSYSNWKGIQNGTITMHPRGIMHGPKPGTYEGSIGQERFDAHVLAVDTFAPLNLAQAAEYCDDGAYPQAWSRATVSR